MSKQEKMTIQGTSVGADEGQPYGKNTNRSISELTQQDNQQIIACPAVLGQEVLQTVSMSELYDTVYQPKVPIVDGLLYSGLYLFVGAPKIGKSFFMAQLGYHVSMGLPLWGYSVNQGSVLYLALEDDYARIQRRLSRMFDVRDTDQFYFAIQCQTVNEGLEQQLTRFIAEHADTRLVIIDTLQKVREAGSDKSGYSSDYEIVGSLKQISDRHGICLLVVHHTRKMESSDSFDMISGTNGLLGAADGAFIVQKEKRTANNAVMEIAGRDQPDQKLHLTFNREQCIWEMVKAETELWKEPPDPILESVAGILSEEQQEWCGTATQLLEQLPGLEVKPNALTRKLNIGVERLIHDYAIQYESSRGSQGRIIKLVRAESKE